MIFKSGCLIWLVLFRDNIVCHFSYRNRRSLNFVSCSFPMMANRRNARDARAYEQNTPVPNKAPFFQPLVRNKFFEICYWLSLWRIFYISIQELGSKGRWLANIWHRLYRDRKLCIYRVYINRYSIISTQWKRLKITVS